MIPILSQQTTPFAPPEHHDYLAYAFYGQPHTPDSILQSTRFPHYDFWKALTIQIKKWYI